MSGVLNMSTPLMLTQTMFPVPPLCIYIEALNSDGLTPLGMKNFYYVFIVVKICQLNVLCSVYVQCIQLSQ